MTEPCCFHLPTTVFWGSGTHQQARCDQKRVALLVSERLRQQQEVGQLCLRLQQQTKLQVLTPAGGEPESAEIDALFDQLHPDTEAVWGLGGGSTLDTAKFLAMLAVSGGRVHDYDRGKRPVTGALPLYLMPTTMGSGSEVTPYAVCTHSQTRRKFTIAAPCLLATAAWVDPTLCLGLDLETLRAGALDSLIHCTEALLSAQPHCLVEPTALAGCRHVYQALPQALCQGLTLASAEALSRAALYGGITIAHSRTGLIHTMAVALAEYLPVSHGLLNGWLVAPVLAFNIEAYEGRLAWLYEQITGSAVADDRQAAKQLTDWLPLPGDVPPWKDRCWKATDVDHLVERVLQDGGLPAVNPRPIDEKELQSLFRGLLYDA